MLEACFIKSKARGDAGFAGFSGTLKISQSTVNKQKKVGVGFIKEHLKNYGLEH